MTTQRRLRFLHGVTAWMLGTVMLLAAVDALTYEFFFVTSLIGFLIVAQLTAPVLVSPAWRQRLKLPMFIGLIVFAAIISARAYAVVSGVLS